MKKIILLIVMVLSLSASDIICQMSTDKYLKSKKLMNFAHERKNVALLKWHSNIALNNLERVIVECVLNDKQKTEARKQRKLLMSILEAIKKGK